MTTLSTTTSNLLVVIYSVALVINVVNMVFLTRKMGGVPESEKVHPKSLRYTSLMTSLVLTVALAVVSAVGVVFYLSGGS